MTGGFPSPPMSTIPVQQVAIATYRSIWGHRYRIALWAVIPLILCTVTVLFEDELQSSKLLQPPFDSIASIVFLLFIALITVPFQVVIHRLTYPGFDFDRGSFGPPLATIYKYYYLYTILLSTIPIIILSIIVYFSYYLFSYYISVIICIFFIVIYFYILISFMLIFPEIAIGVEPALVRAWWLLRGNLFRLVQAIILTSVPAYIVSYVFFYLSDRFGNLSFFLDTIYAAIDSAFSLLIFALWACTLSICYYYITGRQPLAGDAAADTGDQGTR